MRALERPTLHVEGSDDLHAIQHLLRLHGIPCPTAGGDGDFPTDSPEIKRAGSKDRLLAGMATAVSVSNGRCVGFVLDADETPGNRWQAVSDRLRRIGVTLPRDAPEDGFVADVERFKARVGVWLMPDNRRSGALEEFLTDLVQDGDALLPIARSATDQAKSAGAAFAESQRRKAVIHTWLAWQERPGVPYGTALTAGYLRADSVAAVKFVDWFRRVFGALAPSESAVVESG